MDAAADHLPGDYHHGDQDASAQVASYRVFTGLTKWVSLVLAVAILVLSLWFCVGVGFFAGLITGVVLFALGVWFLARKSGPSR